MMPTGDGEGVEAGEPFRPTGLRERICKVVDTYYGEPSRADITYELKADGSGARRQTIRTAIRLLLEEGYLTGRGGIRNSTLYSTAVEYRQVDDPKSDAYVDRMSQREMEDLNDREGRQNSFEI